MHDVGMNTNNSSSHGGYDSVFTVYPEFLSFVFLDGTCFSSLSKLKHIEILRNLIIMENIGVGKLRYIQNLIDSKLK